MSAITYTNINDSHRDGRIPLQQLLTVPPSRQETYIRNQDSRRIDGSTIGDSQYYSYWNRSNSLKQRNYRLNHGGNLYMNQKDNYPNYYSNRNNYIAFYNRNRYYNNNADPIQRQIRRLIGSAARSSRSRPRSLSNQQKRSSRTNPIEYHQQRSQSRPTRRKCGSKQIRLNDFIPSELQNTPNLPQEFNLVPAVGSNSTPTTNIATLPDALS